MKSVDLGCGNNPQNPFQADEVIGVDAHARGENIVNCWAGFERLPFQDNSVDRVTAFDFLEHLPRAIWKDGKLINPFIDCMSEIHRILIPGGQFLARTPAYPYPEAFQDPTHVNIITHNTVSYFAYGMNAWGPGLGKLYGFTGEFQLIQQQWDGVHLVWHLSK